MSDGRLSSPLEESSDDPGVESMGATLGVALPPAGERAWAEALPQIVWMARLDGAIEYFNSRWCEYTGMTPEEARAHESWRALVHPDDLDRLYALRNQAVGEREMFEAEVRLRNRFGQYRWHLIHSVPVRNEAGRVTRRIGTAIDIDGRVRAEEALKAGEERLNTAIDTARLGTWDLDLPTGTISASARCKANFGLPEDATLSSETLLDAILPEDRAQAVEAFERALASGDDYQVEYRIRWPDGSLHWIVASGRALRDDRGKPVRMVGVTLDVTDRRLAEEALRASEEQNRALYSQATTGIAEVDLSGRFLRANDRYCDIVGYTREELLDLRFQDITHPDDLQRNLGLFERVAEELPEYTIEKRYIRKDGREVWARTAVSLIRDGEGLPLRVAAIIEDVTDRKRLEAELGRRMQEMADSDRRKDEFLAVLAHELRNPLAPIRNALHLMGRSAGDEAERAMAERQIAHLARLVDDLMDVSRISQGKIDLRKETVELWGVVNRIVETARPSTDARAITLTVVPPAAPIRLDADPTRLEQILDNVLTNAVKYTDPGGQIWVSAEQAGTEAVVCVRDTGIGIDANMLSHIFEMFVQVDRLPGRAQGGLGIGLGLVKSLVELHGGRIEARSAGKGQGSEFVIHLPALSREAVRQARPPGEDQAQGEGALARRRILVVDDNIDAANSLAKLLNRLYGQETRVAFDGPSALAVTTSFRPHLLLLDIGMPGMDGYEVARRLRERSETKGLLLVALTGWGQETDRQRSREAGFDQHLVKPVAPADLRALLEGLPEAK